VTAIKATGRQVTDNSPLEESPDKMKAAMEPEAVPESPRQLNRNVRLLFATRIIRLFGYGLMSVVLVLHLAAAGLTESQIGLLLTLTLLGDAAISLYITTHADRMGRRRMLLASAVLMMVAGAMFASTRSFVFLLLAATVGVISPSGNEVGPFLAVEQAALSQAVSAQRRTGVFAWYNLVGSFATALGSLCGGALAQVLQGRGLTPLASYQTVAAAYAVVGAALVVLFTQVSPTAEANRELVEATPSGPNLHFGMPTSRNTVLRLAGLFSVDAFAGGFVVQAFVAYWFQQRFAVSPSLLGGIFFAANVLAGISALSASYLAKRIGLLATMVATHLPSNLLLLLVPLMPNLWLAITLLLLRFSISQMDVPTRQAYTMALVPPSERSAAAGVTGIARTLGAALSPIAAGPLYASVALASVPFFLGGGLKVVYDLLIWRSFKKVKIDLGQ
jgi:MFS family permease